MRLDPLAALWGALAFLIATLLLKPLAHSGLGLPMSGMVFVFGGALVTGFCEELARAGVLRWRGESGSWRYCALRGGVFTVTGGRDVRIACREAIESDDLASLEARVAAARAEAKDEARRARLTDWLRAASGDPALAIERMALLSGGAIQQNWALDVSGGRAWVLRTDNAATLAVSHGRAQEFALLRAAFAAGVTVPEPLFLCEDAAVTGAPFFVMRRVAGTAAAHRVVRSETLGGGREACVRALGRQLARIHTIRPPRARCQASSGSVAVGTASSPVKSVSVMSVSRG